MGNLLNDAVLFRTTDTKCPIVSSLTNRLNIEILFSFTRKSYFTPVLHLFFFNTLHQFTPILSPLVFRLSLFDWYISICLLFLIGISLFIYFHFFQEYNYSVKPGLAVLCVTTFSAVVKRQQFMSSH